MGICPSRSFTPCTCAARKPFALPASSEIRAASDGAAARTSSCSLRIDWIGFRFVLSRSVMTIWLRDWGKMKIVQPMEMAM
jgi:hypothetical protein